MKKSKNPPVNNSVFSRYFPAALAGLVSLSYVWAIISIITTSLIPGSLLGLIIIVSLAAMGGLVFGIIKTRRQPKKWWLIALAIIAIALNVWVATLGHMAKSFFDAIHDDGYAYEEYSIIAKKDKHITLQPQTTRSTALMSIDDNSKAVKTETTKYTGAQFKSHDSLNAVSDALSRDDTELVVLKSSYLPILKENKNPFYQSVEVLATFTIKVKQDDLASGGMNKPFVAYISGIDSYGSISGVSRSDVNMLMVVNPGAQQILLVNTPRDYYVQLHGTTGLKDKLTHAGLYGINMSVNTLEDLYQTKINYYVRMNFDSLIKLVDALGGIDVVSDRAFTTNGHTFVRGVNHLNSTQALAFSRERYSFAEGDRARGQNQQRVIEAILRKVGTLNGVANYQSVVNTLAGSFETNAAAPEISTLINGQLSHIGSWSITSVSVDGVGELAPTYTMGSTPLYVMEPDMTTVSTVRQQVKTVLDK